MGWLKRNEMLTHEVGIPYTAVHIENIYLKLWKCLEISMKTVGDFSLLFQYIASVNKNLFHFFFNGNPDF